MNKDLESLKRNWKQLDSMGSNASSSKPFCSASAVRVSSRRQKLMNYYLRLTIVGAMFVFLIPVLCGHIGFPVWAIALVSIYFAIMSVICYSMYSQIKHLDFGNTPTLILLEQVASIYRNFNRHTTFGILIACPVIALMLYLMHANTATFLGGITGAILGSIIGIINNIKVRQQIKEIHAELAAATTEPA